MSGKIWPGYTQGISGGWVRPSMEVRGKIIPASPHSNLIAILGDSQNAHLGYYLASAPLPCIIFPKLKMENGPCKIFVHTPAISLTNMSYEWDGWDNLTLDDCLTLTLIL